MKTLKESIQNNVNEANTHPIDIFKVVESWMLEEKSFKELKESLKAIKDAIENAYYKKKDFELNSEDQKKVELLNKIVDAMKKELK